MRETANPAPCHRHSGLTLVELMIAMLIGLMLIGGVVSIYISGKQTYRASGGMSLLQENGRIAIQRLRRGISSAGYPLNEEIEPIIHQDNRLPDFDGLTSEGEGGQSDTITVAFLSGDGIGAGSPARDGNVNDRDCLGNSGTVDGRVVNSFYIRNGRLMCEGSGNPGRPQPIADAVDGMQILYGLDTNEDGFADQYLNAAAITNWFNVVNIQIALLVNSRERVRDDVPSPVPDDFQVFQLLDAGGRIEVPGDLRAAYPDLTDFELASRAYRVFTTTIPLRNRMPLCDDC